MIKVFKQLKASFFQWLSTGIFALLFVSCVSYYPTSYRAESVLAVTKAGDTIKLPISELRRQYNYNTYSDWQFYYGNNSWYLWSDWRLRYPSYNLWYYDWYRPFGRTLRYNVQPKTRNVPRYDVPQTRPNQPPRSRVATPRGERPTPPQTRPTAPRPQQRSTQPTRTQSTPNVIQRTNTGRGSVEGRRKQ
jgi:hypothetical protein